MFLRCRGAPTPQKLVREGDTPSTPSRDSTGPEADRIAATSSLLDPHTPFLDLFFLFFFYGSGRPFARRSPGRLIPRINCQASVCLSGRGGWPTRPSSSPAHRQPAVPQPHAALCSHDGAPTLRQAVPSSFTRTSSSSCWSGLPPRRLIRSWLTFCPDRIGAVCHAGPGNCHPALPDMSPETLSLAGLSRRPLVRPMP